LQVSISLVPSKPYQKWSLSRFFEVERIGDSIVLGGDEGIYMLNAAGQALFLGPDVDKDGNYQFNFQE